MIKFKEVFFTIVLIAISVLANPAQRLDPFDPVQREIQRSRDREAAFRKRSGALDRLNRSVDIKSERRMKTLKPNLKDFAKYRAFLQQENTGIFRLYPDPNCSNDVVFTKGKCNKIVYGSWEYSFREKDYSYDLRLKDGNFISKNFFSQGILAALGDVPLEEVSSSTVGLKFLLDFAPADKFSEAEKQKTQLSKGIAADGFLYCNSVKAEENKTYVLRVIAYQNNFSETTLKMLYSTNAPNFYLSAFVDPRIDLTVAFRIVRKEKNGSLTILWKQLSSRESPVLSFP